MPLRPKIFYLYKEKNKELIGPSDWLSFHLCCFIIFLMCNSTVKLQIWCTEVISVLMRLYNKVPISLWLNKSEKKRKWVSEWPVVLANWFKECAERNFNSTRQWTKVKFIGHWGDHWVLAGEIIEYWGSEGEWKLDNFTSANIATAKYLRVCQVHRVDIFLCGREWPMANRNVNIVPRRKVLSILVRLISLGFPT